MGGRVYDPLAGRFTTADPILQAPYWSQGQNRYAYVFNDPINKTDPSGFSWEDTGSTGGNIAWGIGAAAWGGTATYAAGSAAGISLPATLSGSLRAVSSASAVAGPVAGVVNVVSTLAANPFQGSDPATYGAAAPSGASNSNPVKPNGTHAVGQPKPPGPPPAAPAEKACNAECMNAPIAGGFDHPAVHGTFNEAVKQIPNTSSTWDKVGNGLNDALWTIGPLGAEDAIGAIIGKGVRAARAAASANKLNHIFGKAEHGLEAFVKARGGPEKAFEAIQAAANKALAEGKLLPGPNGVLPSGNAGHIIDVAGTQIRLIGGRVIDGVVQIGSASMKGLP
jgi:hypothetical protein